MHTTNKTFTIDDFLVENGVILDNIIQAGIEAGIELARDDGIVFELSESKISNGDSSKIENYKTRLMSNKLTEKDKVIIAKYKEL